MEQNKCQSIRTQGSPPMEDPRDSSSLHLCNWAYPVVWVAKLHKFCSTEVLFCMAVFVFATLWRRTQILNNNVKKKKHEIKVFTWKLLQLELQMFQYVQHVIAYVGQHESGLPIGSPFGSQFCRMSWLQRKDCFALLRRNTILILNSKFSEQVKGARVHGNFKWISLIVSSGKAKREGIKD